MSKHIETIEGHGTLTIPSRPGFPVDYRIHVSQEFIQARPHAAPEAGLTTLDVRVTGISDEAWFEIAGRSGTLLLEGDQAIDVHVSDTGRLLPRGAIYNRR